jgi:putative oxidoreductase
MSDILALIGRILLSVLFVWGGWGKLMTAAATQAYIAKSGLPMPEAAYALAVFIELGVGLALVLGLFTRLSGLVLAVWCIVTAIQFHSNFADLNMEIHFLKNVGIAGGMVYVVAFGGGAFSLDALIARRRVVV